MKRMLIPALLLLVAGGLFAQQEVGATDPQRMGIDTAQQYLQEISVDRFEREGFWRASISTDDGLVTARLFEGGPLGREEIPAEEGMDITDKYVLGSRVDFFRRGFMSFTITPIRPIPIEGITKTVSVWVVGRNRNHELSLMIEDFFGRPFELFMGRLNFQGWRKLTVAVPPQADNGMNGIVQRNFNYTTYMGIKVRGFRVHVNPWEAIGSYYIYFDDLRAVTDLFAEHHRDEDDMADGW